MTKSLENLLKGRGGAEGEGLDRLPTLEQLKSEYIEYLLDRTFHNKTETARILNISRTALYYRLSVQQMGGHESFVCHASPRPPSDH